MAKSFGTLVALLCLCFLLLSHTEVRAEKCGFFSLRVQSTVCSDDLCSEICRNEEEAKDGECMTFKRRIIPEFPLRACFCDFGCS